MDSSDLQETGTRAFREGRYDDAIQQLKLAIDADSNNWEARLYLGMGYYRSGRLDMAESVFRHILSKCPDPDVKSKANVAIGPIRTELSKKPSPSATAAEITQPIKSGSGIDHSREEGASSGSMKKPDGASSQSMKKPDGASSQSMQSPDGATSQSIRKPALSSFRMHPAFLAIPIIAIMYGALWLSLPSLYSALFLQPSTQLGKAYKEKAIRSVQKEELKVPGPQGSKLDAWFFKSATSKPLVMINGATLGNIGDNFPLAESLVSSGYSVFMYDYRGFGKSDGTASLTGLLDDALLAHDYVVGKLGYPAKEIVLYGQSVGSGIATTLAQRHESAAVVLESSYPSLFDVARSRNILFKLYPDPLMPEPQLSSASFATSGHPRLLLVNRQDKMIPEGSSAQFASRLTPPVESQILPCKGNVCDYSAVSKFLGKVE